MKQCPQCQNEVPELQTIESGFRIRMQQNGMSLAANEICLNCYSSIQALLTKGAKNLAKQRAKEDNRLQLWKSRVVLVKKARLAMQSKAFAEAAVAYEKYLKSMEVVFDVKAGELNPALFKEAARTKEITVVASVYWDLLRIYDSSDKYFDRQFQAADQLAQFIRYTPVYPDIMRKAQSFVRQSKNPAAIRAFLRGANSNRPRCFIATSAFLNPVAPEVLELSDFRDRVLQKYFLGRAFIQIYYFVSPPLATILDRYPKAKPLVRKCLRFLIAVLRST